MMFLFRHLLGELAGESLTLKSAIYFDETRLYTSARGVWTKGQREFFDVSVFDLLAASYRNQNFAHAYHQNEEEKKRVTKSVSSRWKFAPFVFTATGSMGQECLAFYKQLTSSLVEKRGQSHSTVSLWLRTKLLFA